MRTTWLLILGLVGTACGDDPPPPPPAGATPAATKAAAAKKKKDDPKDKRKQLAPMLHIEDRVRCPTPTSAKACDPKAPTCDSTDYCIAAGNGAFCGPCPEREGIRHAFKPRDFAPGVDNRDPFQSFVVTQPGMQATPDPSLQRDPTQVCTRPDQFKAQSYSVHDLILVGIVAQGTQRKVLMMTPNAGMAAPIIRKGDCVGKEKALTTEIGAGYVKFQLSPDPTNVNQREPQEVTKELYQNPVAMGLELPDGTAERPSGPVIAPPPGAGGAIPGPTTGPNPDNAIPSPPSP